VGALDVAADNVTPVDSLASFSSRGPVSADNSFRLKPDLAAPGTKIRSAVGPSGAGSTDTSYTTMSGTSMATPHVAGAVALIWSAQPSLRNDIDKTEAILNASAFHIPSPATGNCDGGAVVVPNNWYGYGRLDAKAAVDYALLETTSVTLDANGQTHIQFYAGQNRTYRLEEEFDMTNSWQQVPNVNDIMANANGILEFIDPNGASHPTVFYRVRIP
jgi:subtilisin family serine protease